MILSVRAGMWEYTALGSMRCITLVPFAGINPIRFRGSRINGLSLCAHKFRHNDLFRKTKHEHARHSDKICPSLKRANKTPTLYVGKTQMSKRAAFAFTVCDDLLK